MSKINVCVRCSKWRIGKTILTEHQKNAVITLSPIKLLELEYENEVCQYCRQAIGDSVSDEILKFTGKWNEMMLSL